MRYDGMVLVFEREGGRGGVEEACSKGGSATHAKGSVLHPGNPGLPT